MGLWKVASGGDDVNPAVEKLMVPSPLLVKVMEPLAPPIPIMSAFAADAHISGPTANASPLRSFLFIVLPRKIKSGQWNRLRPY